MDEDIELRDYLKVIWKEKFLIIAVTILVFVIVVFFSYIIPSANEYQTDALLYVENIPADLSNADRYYSVAIASTIISNDVIIRTVEQSGLDENEPFKSERRSKESAIQWLKENIEVKVKGKEIEMKLKGPVEPDVLLKTLQMHIKVVTEENKKRLIQDAKNETQKINMTAELLTEQFADAFTSIENIQKEDFSDSTINTELFMDFSQLAVIENRLNDLELQRIDMEYIASSDYNWIEVISSPSGSKIPVGPNRKLNIIIACVLGLFVGGIVAFFKNYFGNSPLK